MNEEKISKIFEASPPQLERFWGAGSVLGLRHCLVLMRGSSGRCRVNCVEGDVDDGCSPINVQRHFHILSDVRPIRECVRNF
jgi:hypothetical protein